MGDLAVLSDFKAASGLSGPSAARILDAAEKMLARMCGRPYDSTDAPEGWLTGTKIEYLNGHGGRSLQLSYTPITSIASVILVHGPSSTTTVSSDDYTYDQRTGLLHFYTDENLSAAAFKSATLGDDWPRGIRNIKVTYTGGYANQAAVPSDLEQLAIDTASALAHEQGRDFGIQSESLGGYAYTLAGAGSVESRVMKRLLLLGYVKGAGFV